MEESLFESQNIWQEESSASAGRETIPAVDVSEKVVDDEIFRKTFQTFR